MDQADMAKKQSKRPNPDKPLTTNELIALFREVLERDEPNPDHPLS